MSNCKAIPEFFQDLCDTSFDNFESYIQKHNISYETLIPYASWSTEKYKRICLERNDDCELVLLCWMPGHKTAVHDHNGEKCQVYFAKGTFEECLYDLSDSTKCVETRQVNVGQTTKLHLEKLTHSLHNVSGELAMTLHLYANPINECKVYGEEAKDTKKVFMSYDVDASNNDNDINQELLKFVEIAQSLVKDEKEAPISKRIPVSELHNTLDIKLSDEPLNDAEFYNAAQEVVLATPKTSSKLFFNQLFGGRQPKAILGDLLAVMLNNSMYTYKVGGVQVGIEKEIINRVIELVGYGKEAGGTFPTGGSMSNFNAMLMGRDFKDKESRLKGVSQKLVAYTSAESHYSVMKNAAFTGIGRHNVRKIVADSEGRMSADVFKKTIQEDIANGLIPFFVNATAGTTVMGAFDPFDQIADICKEFGLWMHIDGAYSGAAILSTKHKGLLKGMEKSDSFSFNPHKMLGTPLTCSIIVAKDKKNLHTSFDNDASYLYQTDEDEYNLGRISFQCGRRNDALKLWTLWKSVGTNGLEKIVDHQFHLADVARNYVRNHPDYTLYSFDDSVSICFNYKNWDANELCTKMYEDNELLVGYGSFNEDRFIRLVTVNANNSEEDILNLFRVIETYN